MAELPLQPQEHQSVDQLQASYEAMKQERDELVTEHRRLGNAEARIRARLKERAEAAEATVARRNNVISDLLDRYVSVVNSGEFGGWDPEIEPEVIAARLALSASSTPDPNSTTTTI